MPATKRQLAYAVAKNAWYDIRYASLAQNLPPDPPVLPPGGVVLEKPDYNSPAFIQARVGRLKRPNEGYLWPAQTQLIGQDRMYGDPGQVPGLAVHPNPWGRAPLHRHHQYAGEPIPLTGQDRFYGDPGQAITFGITERYPAKKDAIQRFQDWVRPAQVQLIGQDRFFGDNGQTTGMVTELPPKGRAPLVQYFLSTNLQSLELFEAPNDIPYGTLNPIALWPAGRAPLNRGFEWPAQVILIGQDRLYGDPGQAPGNVTELWPKGRRPIPQFFLSQNLQGLELFEAPTDIPYGNLNQIVLWPRGRTPLVQKWEWPGLAPLLIGQDRLFGDPGQVQGIITELPPKGRKPPQKWEWPAQVILIGQDRMYGDPGQAPGISVDLPPRAAARLRIDIGIVYIVTESVAPAGAVSRILKVATGLSSDTFMAAAPVIIIGGRRRI